MNESKIHTKQETYEEVYLRFIYFAKSKNKTNKWTMYALCAWFLFGSDILCYACTKIHTTKNAQMCVLFAHIQAYNINSDQPRWKYVIIKLYIDLPYLDIRSIFFTLILKWSYLFVLLHRFFFLLNQQFFIFLSLCFIAYENKVSINEGNSQTQKTKKSKRRKKEKRENSLWNTIACWHALTSRLDLYTYTHTHKHSQTHTRSFRRICDCWFSSLARCDEMSSSCRWRTL